MEALCTDFPESSGLERKLMLFSSYSFSMRGASDKLLSYI